jgi:hypothetical protein
MKTPKVQGGRRSISSILSHFLYVQFLVTFYLFVQAQSLIFQDTYFLWGFKERDKKEKGNIKGKSESKKKKSTHGNESACQNSLSFS